MNAINARADSGVTITPCLIKIETDPRKPFLPLVLPLTFSIRFIIIIGRFTVGYGLSVHNALFCI